jgi:23S rRNA (adenine2503-C2)-methyltransferase
MKHNLTDYTLADLTEYFTAVNLPRFSAGQVFDWVYKKRVEEFNKMTNISKQTKEVLQENFSLTHLKLLKREKSSDATEKFLWQLSDGSKIESVLIPEKERLTLCLSTQVGCKFKCSFCLSGLKGFKRNLGAHEIIGQYLEVYAITKHRVTNIVFMGIGEPLDNFENTVKAICIFREEKGLGLAKRRICISTCGLVPEINKLAQLKLGIKLSISLHSANNLIRTQLMPINKRYPLAELIASARAFSAAEKYPVTFEYVLISGINSDTQSALALVRLLRGINAKINLMVYNCSTLAFRPPSAKEVESFVAVLKKDKAFFTLRRARGQDINAACGQLRAIWENVAN